MFLDKIPSGPLRTNSLLLGCDVTKKAAVIDPAPDSKDAILRHAAKKELHIEKILLTHSHWDHIADVAALKEATFAKVFIHKLDAPALENPLSSHMKIQGVVADGFLEDGKMIQVGKIYILVIHSPGHTPGSVCLYIEKEHLLLSGDTIFKGCMGKIAPADAQLMFSSLKRLSQLPLNTRVIPGHGSETTIEAEDWLDKPENYFF